MEVKLGFESDQGLVGVVRLESIEILENGRENTEKRDEIWNKFCVKEYNTNHKSWANDIKLEITEELGCDIEDITII